MNGPGGSDSDRPTSSDECDSPSDSDCERCRRHAAEFASGVLWGRERAEVLVHLERCERCQSRVRELALTAQRLVDLVPEVDPPAGFEQRVLAAIASAASSPESTTGALRLNQTSQRAPARTGEQAPVTVSKVRPRLQGWSRVSGRGPLANAGTFVAACALLISGGVLAASQPKVATFRGDGTRSSPVRPLSVGQVGQHHRQRMLDGSRYRSDQQRAGDFGLPVQSSAPR
jgi:hypothetical protein